MSQLNVLGHELQPCSFDPLTGYYRTGCCESRGDDPGMHVVCAVMTDEFLAFSKAAGNDLSTPMPQYRFPGLKPGDHWCLCASRFLQAHDEGCAPMVNLAATHKRALDIVPMRVLEQYDINGSDA